MSPTSKTLPRYREQTYGATGDLYVRPIPPSLLRLIADSPEAQRHTNLGERYGELRTRLAALGVEVQKAKTTDADAERKAAETGGKLPKPKVPALEAELEEGRRQLAVLEDLLRESARDLLRLAITHVDQARAEAEAAVERALADARAALQAAEARFTEAGEAAGERAWIGELAASGQVYPWKGGRQSNPAPTSLNALRQAIASFDHDLARAAERKAEAEADRAEALRDLPPGQEVWNLDGSTVVVGQDAEEEEKAPR